MNLNKTEYDELLKEQKYEKAMKMLRDRQMLIDTYQNDEELFSQLNTTKYSPTSAFKSVNHSEDVTESEQ